MQRDRSGFVALDPNLKWLRPTLNCLGPVINDFLKWDGEPPYWNNETASISLLVTAATRARCLAIADYRREKWNGRKDTPGRCDLFIGNKKTHIEIEAKQIYLGPNFEARGKLKSTLKAARNAAKQLWMGRKNRRAGLVIAVLEVRPDKTEDCDFDRFISELKRSNANLVWYWYNPSFDKSFQSNVTDNFYPGVALLFKKYM